MKVSQEEIKARLHELEDEVLLQRYTSGDLTELAQEVIREELRSRGVPVPPLEADVPSSDQPAYSELSHLVRVAGHLTWTEAQVLCSLLEAEGVSVTLTDAHLATVNEFLSLSTGGVRLLVRESDLTQANEIVAAFKRGDYQLDEDIDVGEA